MNILIKYKYIGLRCQMLKYLVLDMNSPIE
jgi:hypothetical protein